MSAHSSDFSLVQIDETVMARLYGHFTGHGTSAGNRIVLIFILAALVHLAVKVIRRISEWILYRTTRHKSPLAFMTERPKFVTVTRLVVSGVIFIIYFFAIGLLLQEFGVNLTAYLASASVIGLAISFGSQGLVQDIVIGLTLIFWDAMDVGDVVELWGTTNVTGRVEEIGLRFTKLRNFYNQEVFVPNRTIANVSRCPRGGIDAYAYPQVPPGADPDKAVEILTGVARGMRAQFAAIILEDPTIGAPTASEGGGWRYCTVAFRIWPGQGNLIEVTFRQQVVHAMRALDPAYDDWQVPVTYRSSGPGPQGRERAPALAFPAKPPLAPPAKPPFPGAGAGR
jgi:small conductance mechanosensitive channel